MAKKDFAEALGAMVNDPPKQVKSPTMGQPEQIAPKAESEKVQINAVIDVDVKTKLDVIAARKGVKKKELINYILSEYVKNNYNG